MKVLLIIAALILITSLSFSQTIMKGATGVKMLKDSTFKISHVDECLVAGDEDWIIIIGTKNDTLVDTRRKFYSLSIQSKKGDGSGTFKHLIMKVNHHKK